ncbi:alpha/beta fold hydrolase [uncultured Enterococcus sp.]|uniref:alpha/beta fold hydrolase n=1 Tax=uncultured Enterococcus sp. TaxID=167972 RepID=UPI00258B27AB|nr:alpha/beta hydrolase [uncultured Enterococcus sp.]
MKLILLHGLGQTTESWREVVAGIGLSEVTVYSLFDTLVPNERVTLERLNQKLKGYLKGNSEPYLLGGLSLGGVMTLRHGMDGDPLLRGIIVAAGQFEAPNKALMALQNSVFRILPPSLLKKSGMDLSKKQLLELMADMAKLDLRGSLRLIEVPTLLLCGTKDRVNLPATKELAELLPQAKIRILPKGKHELNVTSPAIVAAEVNAFIKNI